MVPSPCYKKFPPHLHAGRKYHARPEEDGGLKDAAQPARPRLLAAGPGREQRPPLLQRAILSTVTVLKVCITSTAAARSVHVICTAAVRLGHCCSTCCLRKMLPI